jgi:hypothetical protein
MLVSLCSRATHQPPIVLIVLDNLGGCSTLRNVLEGDSGKSRPVRWRPPIIGAANAWARQVRFGG